MDFIVNEAQNNAQQMQGFDGLEVGKANIKVIGIGGAGNNPLWTEVGNCI